MPAPTILFAARAVGRDGREVLGRRVASLSAFYEPLGEIELRSHWIEQARWLVGTFSFGQPPAADNEVLAFGNPAPPALATHAALCGASDAELRELPVPFSGAAFDADGAMLVTAPVGPTALYEAGGAELTAFSSHAVAAAVLAFGRASVNQRCLGEFLAADFVGGSETMIDGVRAVPPATRIAITASGCASRSFWPADERWALVPEDEAQKRGEDALLTHLSTRLESTSDPVLGLTGGLDSRVVAVALRELGATVSAITWGEPAWPDVASAGEVARQLGMPHGFRPLAWREDSDALRLAEIEARWHDGLGPIASCDVSWPSPMAGWITGAGGEVGRAFYYRWEARNYRDPTPRQATRLLASGLADRLPNAPRHVRRHLTEKVSLWIGEAEAAGHQGWRLLDHVYAEQRLRRWARAMLPFLDAAVIPAFASQPVATAMLSLPLEARISDDFHRRFLVGRATALAPGDAAAVQRSGVPPLVRRGVAVARQRLRRRRSAPALLAQRWDSQPSFRSWIADDVLGAGGVVAAGMGPSWTDVIRASFLAGDGRAEEIALWAAGPTALHNSIREIVLT